MRTDETPSTALARQRFPRGLAQPAGGFRFGADTLLLAAFAARHLPRPKTAAPSTSSAPAHITGQAHITGLELGIGCGAASLGLLLLRPDLDLRLIGIDTGPEMVAAARRNAEALDFSARLRVEEADVRTFRWPGQARSGDGTSPEEGIGNGRGAHLVFSNPPFRLPGTGRAAATPEKDRARFEGPGGFAAFAQCAARSLRPGGLFCLMHLAERLPGLLRGMQDVGLGPELLLPVQGATGKPARLVLLLARCGGRGGLVLEPPLALYGPDGALSPEAEAFCPFLSTNSRRGL